MERLGMMHAFGVGTLQEDKANAVSLLRQSIELGNDFALIGLARVMYEGDVTSDEFYEAQELLWRAQKSLDPEVVKSANFWLSQLKRDQKAVGTRNVVEQRREQIDAMTRALEATADSAFEAMQNLD